MAAPVITASRREAKSFAWNLPATPAHLDVAAAAQVLAPMRADAMAARIAQVLRQDERLSAWAPRPQPPTAEHVYGVATGTPAVVFDLDGTLTTGNSELFYQLLCPQHLATPRPGAIELTWAWAARGYLCVYLTGRPTALAPMTRGWFEAMGFAPGVVHFAQRRRDVLPSHGFTGAFKRLALSNLRARGLAPRFAYGNVGTDVRAYRRTGLTPNHIVTTGARPGRDGTVAAPTFETHLAFVAAQADDGDNALTEAHTARLSGEPS